MPTSGATLKQVALFDELLERKQFPDGTDPERLTGQFATLTRKAASEWIDKALALPNRADEDDTGNSIPAPF